MTKFTALIILAIAILIGIAYGETKISTADAISLLAAVILIKSAFESWGVKK